jgi:transcription initiation factor IIE alpha subunit
MKQKIYINNILDLLKELSKKEYQDSNWTQYNPDTGMSISFDEAVNMLFDDCIIDDLLESNEVIISHDVTRAFKELSTAVDSVDEYRPQEEIINDPQMQIVREKAAKALALVLASDGSESTVEIIED